MADLTEEIFVKNIQSNPHDLMGVGVFADWLEEQGDERAAPMHEFFKACQERSLSGEIWETVYSLASDMDKVSARRCMLDILTLLARDLNCDDLNELLDSAYVAADSDAKFKQVSQQLRTIELDVEDFDRWYFFLQTLFLTEATYAVHWLVSSLHPTGDDIPYLILTSYAWFGVNVVT